MTTHHFTDYPEVSPDIVGGVVRYVEHGIPPGDFLTAVLANDLQEAVGRADVHNLRALPNIVALVYNDLPGGAWGGRQSVKDWLGLNAVERDRILSHSRWPGVRGVPSMPAGQG